MNPFPSLKKISLLCGALIFLSVAVTLPFSGEWLRDVLQNAERQVGSLVASLSRGSTAVPAQAPPITRVVQIVQVITVTQVAPVTRIAPITRSAPDSNGGNCALQFDGFDDYVYLGKWFNYDTFTISMWVNPGASQNEYADIMDNNHTDYRSWVFQQEQVITNKYHWGEARNPPVIYFALPANRWQYLAVSRGAESELYINSELVGKKVSPQPITYDGTQVLHLARWGAGGRNWKGQMDEVQIWDTALTQEQIQENMHRRLIGNEEGLLAYYRFDECGGSQLVDSSPNRHDGTLAGSPAWVASGVSLGE